MTAVFLKSYTKCSGQIIRIYRPPVRDSILTITAVPIQQQIGSSDCGLFSIATVHSST